MPARAYVCDVELPYWIEVTVTPVPAHPDAPAGATVVIPAPNSSTVRVVPTIYATDEFGGIQNVFADALFIEMNKLASPSTGV